MKIIPRYNYLSGLESIAMTDIILNMFIFFFISFSLLYTFNPHRIQKLDVKLPKASQTTTIGEQEQINITLNNEGLIFVGEDLVSLKELKGIVSTKLRNNPELIVILRADRLVSFNKIVGVLDTLTELGITNLHIAAIRE
ncbi:MAG: biopolymer transporter ExbD [Candidatus Omnitrophica bacterium]|nr:biopolymer transporter ExbD [Candidatus Omnitrophota bacterium]